MTERSGPTISDLASATSADESNVRCFLAKLGFDGDVVPHELAVDVHHEFDPDGPGPGPRHYPYPGEDD